MTKNSTPFQFISNLAAGAVSEFINGALNTAGDAADCATCLKKGHYRNATGIAAGCAGLIARGAIELIRNSAVVTAACCDALLSEEPHASKENEIGSRPTKRSSTGALASDKPSETGEYF